MKFTSRLIDFRYRHMLAGAILLSGTIMLFYALKAQERQNIERMAALKTDSIAEITHNYVDSVSFALVRMAKRWEMSGIPTGKEWESDAGLYITHFKGYEAIAWVDPSLNARRTAGPGAMGEGFFRKFSGVADEAKTKRMAVLTESFDISEGERGFAVLVPVFLEGRFEGFIAAVVRSRELLDSILADKATEGYGVEVFDQSGRLYGIASGREAVSPEFVHEKEVEIHGRTWRVRVLSDNAARFASNLPYIILVMGFFASLALSFALYFADKAWQGKKKLESVNEHLERENTERRRAEDEAKRHAIELERSNAELEQFAYVASHDLQEPLRVVAGYVQLLGRRYRGKLDQSADEFIGFAVDGVMRMQRLINDLLVYSKVGSEAKFSTIECDAVLSRTLSSLKASMDERGAEVSKEGLPVIFADASQIEHLFQNLIGNAIKYCEKAPAIHVEAEKKAGEWLFKVSDNGIGMDPKHSERIFLIFQRLHGKQEYSGTGIGLAICKKVVENHKGRIWVESAPGAGSTFYFTIPEGRG